MVGYRKSLSAHRQAGADARCREDFRPFGFEMVRNPVDRNVLLRKGGGLALSQEGGLTLSLSRLLATARTLPTAYTVMYCYNCQYAPCRVAHDCSRTGENGSGFIGRRVYS